MWNQVTKLKVRRVASQRLETIDDVINMQRRMGPALEGLTDAGGGNPVRAFNDLYLQVTQDVKQNIVDGIYNDSHFMEILDVEFARLYFESLHRWAHDKVIPASWALLFKLENDGERHTDFEGVLLGVNAHVNRDLTFALINANARAGEPAIWAERRQDYDQINQIFRDRLDPIVNRLVDSLPSKPWNLLWRIVDDSLREIDEWIMYKAIVECRDRAWNRSEPFGPTFELNEAAKCSGRSLFASFLARMVLGTHLFDSGLFPSIESRDIETSTCDTPTRQQLDEALPHAAEVLFGSDLLEMKVHGGRIAIQARNRGIDGQWEGELGELASLFTCEWVLGTVDAESDSDVEVQQIRCSVELLRSKQKSLTAGF